MRYEFIIIISNYDKTQIMRYIITDMNCDNYDIKSQNYDKQF